LKPFYSGTGRPSIDPGLMIRILMVGYCMGIRSERRLCQEVHLNLAYRWFCRLGLDGKVPDHSTFSKNRHGRFRESDILGHLFETIVERCLAEGLVGAEGFAVDASLISADCNKSRSLRSEHWNPDELKNEAARAAREFDSGENRQIPKRLRRKEAEGVAALRIARGSRCESAKSDFLSVFCHSIVCHDPPKGHGRGLEKIHEFYASPDRSDAKTRSASLRDSSMLPAAAFVSPPRTTSSVRIR
jgi:transposase